MNALEADNLILKEKQIHMETKIVNLTKDIHLKQNMINKQNDSISKLYYQKDKINKAESITTQDNNKDL